MAEKFRWYVDKEKIKIKLDKENLLRYYLIVPFKETKKVKKAIVILKNPSEAIVNHEEGVYESDRTVNRVLEYFRKKKFSEVVILNLFACYEKYSEKLNKLILTPDRLIGKNNDSYIKDQLNKLNPKQDIVVVAWGSYPQKSTLNMKELYLERILQVEEIIKDQKVYYVDRLVKNKFPLHGLAWHIKEPRALRVYKK